MKLNEIISTDIHDIKEQLDQMLELSHLVYDNPNYGGMIVVGIGDYRITPNDGEEDRFKHYQSKIYKEYNSVIRWIEVLIAKDPDRYKRMLKEAARYVLDLLIDEKPDVYERSMDDIRKKILESLNKFEEIINSIYSGEERVIIIPDTSTLLNNEKFETWAFQDLDEFDIYITPNVLREIDNTKRFHKSVVIMKRAQKIDKRFKGYFKQGNGKELISIIKDKINISFIAIDPKFDGLFEDLDKTIPDDRFIASAIEIMRNNINSDCYILADDLNLINKANHFKLPTINFL